MFQVKRLNKILTTVLVLPWNTFVGLSNPSQMRWPRDTYASTRRNAFYASV